jgi:hypothetical protein
MYFLEEDAARRHQPGGGKSRHSHMKEKVEKHNIAKAADVDLQSSKKAAPFWKRVPVGWIIVALLIVSWVAFLLMTNGIWFLFSR